MIKRMVRRYNNWKLGKKLLFSFIIGSIIPILIITGVGYGVNVKVLRNKIDQLMVSKLNQISERVHLNMENYSNLLYQIYADDEIIESVIRIADVAESEKAFEYNRIYNNLKQYNNSKLGIRCISIVCYDGTSVIVDFQTDSVVDNIWRGYDDLRRSEPFQDAIDQPNIVISPTMKFQDKDEEQYYLHLSKRLFNFNNLEQDSIATVIISIDERLIDKICNPRDQVNEELDNHSLNFIVNKDRRVVTYPDSAFAGININPKLDITEFVQVTGFLRDRTLAVNQYVDQETGWTFYNVYDQDYMVKDIVNVQTILLITGGFIILLVVIIMTYTIYMMNISVKSLLKGIHETQEGNLEVVVPEKTQDEFGVIAKNFNIMTIRIRDLIRKEQEAKTRQKDAEIRALEAQINPHFLYNTLDSINWMAIEKGEFEISTMLRNLGVILRYSINKSNQLTTIEEMEDWLHKYIGLQKMRFNDSFSYEINIDKDIFAYKIHKLLLQPFIENAIIHGFKETESGGYLSIEGSLADDGSSVIFIIEDNGAGMEAEQVEEFNDKQKAIKDDGRSIGLHNAFSRIYMYYEDKASWNTNSILGLGTVITLRLPYQDDRED